MSNVFETTVFLGTQGTYQEAEDLADTRFRQVGFADKAWDRACRVNEIRSVNGVLKGREFHFDYRTYDDFDTRY